MSHERSPRPRFGRSRLLTTSLVLFLASGVIPTAHADEGGQLDLASVIRLAFEQNAGYRAELARRDEVLGGVEEVGADAWPQVELVGNWNRNRNPSLLNSRDFEDLIDAFPDFEPRASELWTVAVTVEQPLYSGGKVRAAIDLAELVVDITDAQIATTRLDLALDAAEIYYLWLRAESALGTLEIQRRAREEALQVVMDRYELGLATELERLRSVAALAEVEPQVAAVEGNLQSLGSRARILLGLTPSTPVRMAAPRSSGNEEPTELTDAPHLPALLELANERRPELKDLRLQTEALERQRVTTLAEKKPQVDLSGAYGRQVRLLDNLDDDLFADWRVTVGVSWNLFDGGRVKGQVAQIDSQREQLRWRIEEQKRRHTFEIEQSLVDYETARRRWQASHRAAEAANEAWRVARESYSLGVAIQADLLDAQDTAVSQELQRNEAFYDCLLQAARLRRAIGLLPTEALPGSAAGSSSSAATPDPATRTPSDSDPSPANPSATARASHEDDRAFGPREGRQP